MIDLLSYNSNLTAVVAYNDTMAAGAISVLNENNIKVPKQFSIVGFDDMPIARYLIPKLTTIRYPIDLMANYGKTSVKFSRFVYCHTDCCAI